MPRVPYVSKAKIKIDPHKHDAKIKEIEDARKEEARLAALAAEEEEEEWNDEEEEEEEEEELYVMEAEDATQVGRIDLSFPETTDEFSKSDQCYPPSYYTLSPKERLLLLFAENFRHQFVINNSKRRPLVLALPNECNIQKFVCTTIRPTAFLHTPLIRNAEECASFVADFILYEPLDDMMSFPTRLMSPSSLLRRRKGNSFEMATLLCSMLIGAGFPAVVVSGVARAETVENIQRAVPFPHKILEVEPEEEVKPKAKTGHTYKLRPMPDLESHLQENVATLFREKAEEKQRAQDEIKQRELEELELHAADRYHYRRSHAWVAIIDNAPWSIKPKKTYINENGDSTEKPPTARFIEPTTGLFCETHCKNYILIDSVWNQAEYYVNKQKCLRVNDIRWDLQNTDDWEHLLPGEPAEMRAYKVHSDENIAEDIVHPIEEERHLDTTRSWVMRLHIGEREFEERFPKLQKTIFYKGSKYERFAPYSQRDGKIKKLTLYADDEYKEPRVLWEYYENRGDMLLQFKYSYETSESEETFGIGRNDNLKFLRSSKNPLAPKELYFYSAPRLDSLQYLKIESDRIVLQYSGRSDLCCYQEFEFKPSGQDLKKIVEKFNRNPTLSADKDIAVRSFLINQRKILLKFHYARGALTASTREFIKPPKPDYGKEVIYEPELTKSYKANTAEQEPTQLELYRLLLAQLQYEEKIKKQFEKIQEEINAVLDQRRNEMKNPIIKFRVFDSLRNGAARRRRLQQYADEEAYQREMRTKPADFLAPYLVAYKNRYLTYEESWAAYNACLFDLKSRFVGLLNDLQRQYEDLTTESKSLHKFLNKFENQFNNYDYEQLVNEAKEIGLNKRMVQQRLTLTHEESQKKYETVKESLINDPRLNLIRN